ncbi:hypothetical protein OPQ81_003248 [Rhizoctonia solani]|nr:hypothetical protein OPQ81_003248 [Rhizoctonia solani]
MLDSTAPSTSPRVVISPWTEHTLEITTLEHKYQGDGYSWRGQRLGRVVAPVPRYHHSSSIVSGSGNVYIFGGMLNDQLKNDTWAIRLSGDSKQLPGPELYFNSLKFSAILLKTTGNAPSPRAGHLSVLTDGLLIVWGGATSTRNGSYRAPDDSSIYSLDLTTNYWTKLDVQPSPRARFLCAACMSGSRLIVFGGSGANFMVLDDLWSLDFYSWTQGTPKWERIEAAPGSPSPLARAGHAMVAYDERLYVFGGFTANDVYLNDIWCFDLETRTWAEVQCTGVLPSPRECHSLSLVGDAVYLFGGMEKFGVILGDMWSFKISEKRWYRFPNMNHQPSERFGHTMATYEMRMLVFGGTDNICSLSESKDMSVVHILETDMIEYPTKGDEITLKAMPRVRQSYPTTVNHTSSDKDSIGSPIRDTITGAMSASEILRCLTVHGCRDISQDLDILHVSEYPVSTGGFGDVYCATLRSGDRVGLKCIRMLVGPTEEGKTFLKHAAHELYVWSKCKHPSILELSGVALFRDQIAMVSPWMEHGHVRWFLSQYTQVDRGALCAKIADGIGYMHKIGMVHGDLKPENILVARDHTPKLTDFGNAVLSEYTLQFTQSTTTQRVSMRWTAPEILNEETKTTQAGDIYALGMIIFVCIVSAIILETEVQESIDQEVMTGVLPYAGASEPVIMCRILAGKFPSRPEIYIPTGIAQADQLWSLITSCWAYDPGKRPKASEVKNTVYGIMSEGLAVNRS